MKPGRLYVTWVIFVALILLASAGSVSAASANWFLSEDGLPPPSISQFMYRDERIFQFGSDLYCVVEDGLYMQMFNQPCFGWRKVETPSGVISFRPVGDYLFAIGSTYPDLWWIKKGDSFILENWKKVTSNGISDDPYTPGVFLFYPMAVFNNQIYGVIGRYVYDSLGNPIELVPTYFATSFDIYRSADVGQTTMTWSKVVAEGFGDPQNHDLGYLGVFNNKLIAVTDSTYNMVFGAPEYYLNGIQVWESPTGASNDWTQVNVDGFGTEVNQPTNYNQSTRVNCAFGAAAEYNGYFYVGTESAIFAEIWRYDGTGKTGWKNVTPPTLGAGSNQGWRVMDMVVFENLLYVAQGYPTPNLLSYDDGANKWTIVEPSPHPIDSATNSIRGLAVLPSKPTPPWGPGPAGDKLFALTLIQMFGDWLGGYQFWSYPFPVAPPSCTALKQATIAITPKTSTSELLPGATYPVTVKIDAGTGFDFGQVFVPLEVDYYNFYYGGGGSKSVGQGWVSSGTWTQTFGADLSPSHTPPLDPLHPSQMTVCFNNSEKAICDTATHTWVDTIPPTITITAPANGAKYLIKQVVTAQYTVYDAAGVLSTSAPVPVGKPIQTSKLGSQTFTVTAKDYGNNTATQSVTYQVLTPLGGTKGLRSEVSKSQIPKGIKDGLIDKLNPAINALDDGNKRAAINDLNAFINLVKAQLGKNITNAQADSWIAEAQNIINSIKAS